jgi:hypothetical protein
MIDPPNPDIEEPVMIFSSSGSGQLSLKRLGPKFRWR